MACSALAEAGPAARAVAGCTAVSPFALSTDPKVRLAVDLTAIGEGQGIETGDSGMVRVGALTTIAELADDAGVRSGSPMLAHVADHVGDEVIRRMATVGGNVTARPPVFGELPVALAALGAELEIATTDSLEITPVAAAMGVPGWLPTGSVVAAVKVPVDPTARWAYRKLTTNMSSYGIASMAITVADDGRAHAFASLGTPVPQRLGPVEEALASGGPFDAAVVARDACSGLVAGSDALASSAYRIRGLRGVIEQELAGLLTPGVAGRGP